MTSADPITVSPGAAAPPGALERLASLDAFRGLVIVTMVFVNYLAGIADIPPWARHLAPEAEGYTFVDLVFPAFLFIVGVSMPMAFHKRLTRGEPMWSLIRRILVRAASLLLVGVIMVNSGRYSATATGIPKSLWYLLAMLCVVAIWNQHPPSASGWRKRLFLGLRIGGGVLLAALLLMFRSKGGSGGNAWMEHSWWGILGLIGWAYLVCGLAYVVLRGNSLALMGTLGFLLALYVGDKHNALDWAWLEPVHRLVGIGPVLGSTAANVMIGVLVGNCFVGAAASGPALGKARFFLLFGLGLYCAGQLIRPVHGINKNAATDAYTLVAGGICCLCFLLVYVLMDVLKLRKWAGPVVPVGQNALLAYMLPGLLEDLISVLHAPDVFWHYDRGLPGALNTAAMTLVIAFLTWAATRAGVRLRL